MNNRPIMSITALGLAAAVLLPTGCQQQEIPEELPNILWITSEDNSPYFIGCYGNPFATTPNIDQLAADGFKYMHAYANCPVCSPARNTIITGVYAASNGNEQMRSTYPMSEDVNFYPEYLRQAGYYCTNNSKTDYNYDGDYNAMWDECSRDAHYYNRPEGQPFFAIYNLMTTHESRIHQQIPTEELIHSPEEVVPYIAPYHPLTEEVKHDWAQYYDRNQQMDEEVGALMQELEDRGEADNTIVFYYGDHGGVLARSKRYIYNTGTQVPFVVRIPEKYKYLFPEKNPGDEVDRIISFVDLAPTLLSIAGIPIPDYMQGDAFLGQQKTRDPEYAYMTRQRMDERYDMVRAVTDGKYRYIRNYMPFRISLQHLDYLFNAPSAQSWEDVFFAGATNQVQSRAFYEKAIEELYDTENDPWEINNLAEDPGYEKILIRMRDAEEEWMRDVRDVGLIPETEYSEYMGDGSMYDYMRSADCPFKELLEAAQLATEPGEGDIDAYIANLDHPHNAIRYWGAAGLLINVDNAGSALDALKTAIMDESGAVATLAAEALYRMGEEDLAWETYIRIMEDGETYDMADRNFALNSVDAINDYSSEIIETVKTFYETPAEEGFGRYSSYDMTMSEYLLNKWRGELYFAALEGQEEEVLMLLKGGIDVNTIDEEGRTALMYAAFNGHQEIVEKLIEEGAQVNISDNYGRTPLIFASSGPYPITTKFLLDNGAEIDVYDDEEHFTALMYAAAEGQTETVELLLSYGANPDLKDVDGDMAVDFARNNGYQEVVSLLEPVSE